MRLTPEQRKAFERRAREAQWKSRREYVDLERARDAGYTYLVSGYQRWHAIHSAEARRYLFDLIGEKP